MNDAANEKASRPLKTSFEQTSLTTNDRKIPDLKKDTSPEGFLNNDNRANSKQRITTNLPESPSKLRFHDYEISLHPTCLFPDKQEQQTDEGYLNTTNSSVENILEDNLYEKRASLSRRPSQLSQDLAAFNALCPPSHVLKARRLSKNTIKASVSTPIISSTPGVKSRKPSFVDNYQKEFSSNSAVSPRFMALRKLSEVTSLPPHSLSFSAVPPVPQIPTGYLISAETKEDDKMGYDLESRVLSRIDDIIETQLQFHLGQIVWRASENHLEARRFWEEQKKEMLSFAANAVDRMEAQVDMQRRTILEAVSPPSEHNSQHKDSEAVISILEKELALYKSKSAESQRQLFEFEVLKTRNAELEKQHEIDLVSLQTMTQKVESLTGRLKELEEQRISISTKSAKKEPASVDRTKLYNLETQNKQLKNQIKQMQEINQQLLEEATVHENKIKAQTRELRHTKNQLAEAELAILNNKRKMAPTTSTSTMADGIDCSEDFGKKIQKSKKAEDWADMMQSEDEAKKTADEWALKYRELQAKYYDICVKLEKKDDKQKLQDLTELLDTKDEEIRHLKQAENVNRIQIDYLQLELDKYQKKSNTDVKQKARRSQPPRTRPITPVNNTTVSNNNPGINTTTHTNTVRSKPQTEPGYITEDGYLTFTTEINGKPSRYSIKIPQGYQQDNSRKSKLNPNASAWKKQ